MADFGRKLDLSSTTLDSSLSVASGGSWVDGSIGDLGASGPWPDEIALWLSITGGATDGYDHQMIVQFSDDSSFTTAPNNGEGVPVYNVSDTTGGADYESGYLRSVAPKARYFRTQHKNDNSSDSVTVDVTYLEHMSMDSN